MHFCPPSWPPRPPCRPPPALRSAIPSAPPPGCAIAPASKPAPPLPPDSSHVKAFLLTCLKGPQVLLKMEAVKVARPERPPRYRGAWPPGEVIANQACGELAPLDPKPGAPSAPAFYPAPGEVIANQYALPASPPAEPLECPTCGHAYNYTHKRPRLLSCLHSVCEECLQILYESCPKYKFISCPSCKRETVLFTDYGLAALAVNARILARLPAEGLSTTGLSAAGASPWGAEADRGCYQSFRQYCGAACACRVRNPVSSCAVM
ncbi:RING finger protein 208 [Lacerta agilis]|uniref:RING finger protein 208 n=1 Tax=Lacerta agilis TaxID=80427 RepID=UPI001419E7AB|nr:RING finger protein 208 [Lacerta agilis]